VRTEQVTIRLPPDLAAWVRRRAKEDHTTQTAVIVAAVRFYRDLGDLGGHARDAALFARACLYALADSFAAAGKRDAAWYVRRYAGKAAAALGRREALEEGGGADGEA
jgi:hypothetical protein